MSKQEENICIIGRGGFIGSALRGYLQSTGRTVYIIGRSLNIPLAANECYFSVAEYSFEQLEEMLKDKHFATIIDLAYTSIPGTSYDDPVKDFSENLYNVIRHLDFALAVKAKRFIYVSSGGTIYGEALNGPFTEESQNFPLSPYGVTKLACERYVYMYHRLHGMSTVIVRPSNIYGPGQKPFRGQGLVATALGLAFKGEPIHIFGDGSHVRDYLFIDDFCAAIGEIVAHGKSGEIYNIGFGNGTTIQGLIDCINDVLQQDGRKLSFYNQPERPFDVHYNVLNTNKLMQLNGWQPQTNLKTGITYTWQWIKEYVLKNRL